jgi:23S rRNA (uracil1939-C5)-methyltransferase
MKRQVVRDQLHRIGRFTEPPVSPTVGCDNPWGYRNHIRFSAKPRGEVGFVRRGTHRFLRIDRCLIADPWINDALPKLQGKGGGLHQIAIRRGVKTGELLIHPDLSAIEDSFPSGQKHYHEQLLGHRFRVSGASFFQTNTPQAERLIELVRDRLAPQRHETLVDAYAGVGTFAVILAPLVERVVAIEESAAAVDDAMVNAAASPNVQYFKGKVEDVLPLSMSGWTASSHRGWARIPAPSPRDCGPSATHLRLLRSGDVGPGPAPSRRRRVRVGRRYADRYVPADLPHRVVTWWPPRSVALVLASSLRAAAICSPASVWSSVRPVDVDEDWSCHDPRRRPRSPEWAEAARLKDEHTSILAADTIAVIDGQMLGKRRMQRRAREMLQRASRTHDVVTAVALIPERHRSVIARNPVTHVTMRDYSDEEIEAFIATGTPFDKAGGYAIQDGGLAPVAAFDGCYCNVIGLSLWATIDVLRKGGIRLDITPDALLPQCAVCPLPARPSARVNQIFTEVHRW